MKKLILLSLALASLSAFARENVQLPLASGTTAAFSGESTLVSHEAPEAVVESTTFGHAKLFDLYERSPQGVTHRQFLRSNGKLEAVVERQTAPGETMGPYVGKPLSPAGARQLGVASIFSGDPAAPFGDTDDRDARLAPWLDLKNGGIAQGACNAQTVKDATGKEQTTYGSLLNGSLLPAQSEGLTRLSHAEGNYGTGEMISMLEHAAAEFVKTHAGMQVFVGGIAKQFGGFFPPHNSHQSGLDADVTYLGTDGFDTQLEKDGSVKASFETEKNWEFFRLLFTQRIVDQGKERSAVSMIIVDPRIKQHFCQWTKANGHTDATDFEILRHLYTTVGHDDHFHLRLRCSPYYPLCFRQNYDPKETGCEN